MNKRNLALCKKGRTNRLLAEKCRTGRLNGNGNDGKVFRISCAVQPAESLHDVTELPAVSGIQQ
jgi:hypothetical protein